MQTNKFEWSQVKTIQQQNTTPLKIFKDWNSET